MSFGDINDGQFKTHLKINNNKCVEVRSSRSDYALKALFSRSNFCDSSPSMNRRIIINDCDKW